MTACADCLLNQTSTSACGQGTKESSFDITASSLADGVTSEFPSISYFPVISFQRLSWLKGNDFSYQSERQKVSQYSKYMYLVALERGCVPDTAVARESPVAQECSRRNANCSKFLCDLSVICGATVTRHLCWPTKSSQHKLNFHFEMQQKSPVQTDLAAKNNA